MFCFTFQERFSPSHVAGAAGFKNRIALIIVPKGLHFTHSRVSIEHEGHVYDYDSDGLAGTQDRTYIYLPAWSTDTSDPGDFDLDPDK